MESGWNAPDGGKDERQAAAWYKRAAMQAGLSLHSRVSHQRTAHTRHILARIALDLLHGLYRPSSVEPCFDCKMFLF
jgi:hypothetical protein